MTPDKLARLYRAEYKLWSFASMHWDYQGYKAGNRAALIHGRIQYWLEDAAQKEMAV